MVRGLPGYRSLGKTDAQIWPADLAAVYRANDEQVIATKKPLNTLEHYFQLRGKKRYMAGSKFPSSTRPAPSRWWAEPVWISPTHRGRGGIA